VTTATVNQLLTGKRGISHVMAKSLGLALGIAPQVLATIQAEWDLRQTEEPPTIIETRSRLLSRYPLREMVRRGWLPETEDPRALERGACRFFEIKNMGDTPQITHAAKRSGDDDDVSGPQSAWLCRVRQIARTMQVPAYSPALLKQAMARLSQARGEPESVRHVPRALRESGVRFVVVEGLPSSEIDGVCFWLNDTSPVIGMSLRFDRIDNFWFVLAHECSHALHGHGKDGAPIIDADLVASIGREIRDEEKIANRDGANFCVPQDKMTSFYLRKNPLFAERDVLAFAKRMDVHPGLIVGQLHWRTGRFELLRKHLARIRDHLSTTMMLDGWGDVMPVTN